MNAKKNNIRNIALIIISIILLLTLIIIGGHSKKSNNSAVNKPSMQRTLNTAIVNEDNGITFRGHSYNLGKEYTDQLHNGHWVNYTVIPRSIAEAGLKHNNYQLVVYIPNNFSKQIVNINNPDPSKLNLQYKIDAHTPTMKNRCQQVANNILQDLNERLIDIYTLGIMGNLYNAQQQVNGIYHRQGSLANDYQNQLFTPISNFSQTFPDLQSNTKDALQTNKCLQKNIQQSAQSGFQNDFEQLQSTNNSVKQLIQLQSQSDHNQAELIKKLMNINQQTFDSQTQAFIKNMQQQNQQLSQASQNTADQTNNVLLKEFNQYSQTYEQEIIQLNKNLEQRKQTQYKQEQNLLDKLHHQYNVTGDLTLGAFIQKNNPELYEDLIKQSRDVTALQKQYNQLPFAQIPNNVQKALSKDDYQTISNALQQINNANQEINKTLSLQGARQLKINGNSDQINQFNNLINDKNSTQVTTQAITFSNINQMQGDTFTLHLPNDVTVDQNALDDNNVQVISQNNNTYQLKVEKNNGSVTLPLHFCNNPQPGQSIATLTYQHKPTTSQQVINNVSNKVVNNNSNDNSSNTITNDKQEGQNDKARSFVMNFDLAKQFINGDSYKQQQLSKLEGKWIASYTNAAIAAKARANLAIHNNIEQVLEIPLDKSLQDLISQNDNQNLENDEQILQNLNDNEQKLVKQKSNYLQTLATVGKNSQQNIKTAQAQLSTLQSLQDKFTKLQQSTPTNDKNESHIDQMQTLLQTIGSLATNTKALQGTISNDVQQFNSVYDNFNQLNNQLSQVQSNSKGLQHKSMNMQVAFKKELARSGNFTQSFIKILNNGYHNGVPNEKLLSFIANPIQGQSQIVVNEKTQAYNMTLWTMIIAILAYFIAYAIHNLKYFQSEQYFSRFHTRVSRHFMKLLLLLVLSIIVGTIVSMISQSQLPIINADRLLWFITVIGMTMLTTLCFYLLITYLGILGVGLISALFIIFIFVQVQSGTILSKINVFHLISMPMLNVIMLQEQDVLLTLVIMFVLLIASILICLFVPDKQSEVKVHETM